MRKTNPTRWNVKARQFQRMLEISDNKADGMAIRYSDSRNSPFDTWQFNYLAFLVNSYLALR